MKPASPPPLRRQADVATDFLRGLVASGLLGAVQRQGGKPRLNRRTARLALQGGSALAAGCAASRAWQNGQPMQVLASATIGITVVLTLEHLLQDTPLKEIHDGQEEA